MIAELEKELELKKSNPLADTDGAAKEIDVVKKLAEKHREFLRDKFIPVNPLSRFPNVVS